jgi:23S rRNA (uridine2552-2'-O)-methyltransferase
MTDEEPPRKRMVKPPAAGIARAKPARLKTARKRTSSQQAWLERQINDPFAARARAEGYRSRAAYKLAEIDDRFKLLRKGCKVIDLGAAPGGWVQIALERGASAVVGVDLLAIDPIPPAELIQMDFTDPACAPRLIELIGGRPDVIVCDIAPNTMGHKPTDHLRIVGLIEAALDFALEVLPQGGSFVTKAFQGGEMANVLKGLKGNFTEVRHFKPKASRSGSSELYLVATGRKGGA